MHCVKVFGFLFLVSEVIQTVALVHCDLHEEKIISSLNYMASTIIELQPITKIIKGAAYKMVTHVFKALHKHKREFGRIV